MKDKFYVTTPIYYVNDRPHLGHAYTTLAADVLARWQRKRGHNTFFLTGSDEHGLKIEKKVFEEKPNASLQKIQEFVDSKTELFKRTWKKLNISNNNFIRTTSNTHSKAVINVLNYLWNKKLLYLKKYKGLYCAGCEEFKKSSDLLNGKCPFHSIKPKIVEEKSYFFKLSQFQNKIEKMILSDKLKIEPEIRKNEVLKFLEKGLEDVSISRENVRWGIPVPFNKKHTTYVWLDAFLNYLTGLGWRGPEEKLSDNFLTFWPPDVQLMGKDILRVHSTIWIGMLLALRLPLPKKMLTHCFLLLKKQKMSKSIGNVIFPEELIEKFGTDGTRYLLLSESLLQRDGSISWEIFKERYRIDLSNGLGNLVNRVFKLIQISGIKLVPFYHMEKKYNIKEIKKIKVLMNSGKFSEIIKMCRKKITQADQLIEKERVWELARSDQDKAKKILTGLIKTIIELSYILEPFIPETSQKILKAVNNNYTLKRQLFPGLTE